MAWWHPDKISTKSRRPKTNPKFPLWLSLVVWWCPDKIPAKKSKVPRPTSSSILPSCWRRGGDGGTLTNFTMTGVKAATSSSLLPSCWRRGGVVPPYQTSWRKMLRQSGCETTNLKKKYKHPHLTQTQNFQNQNSRFIHDAVTSCTCRAHLLLPVDVWVAMVPPYQTSRRQNCDVMRV